MNVKAWCAPVLLAEILGNSPPILKWIKSCLTLMELSVTTDELPGILVTYLLQQLDMYRCILSTVATDALMPKHQAIH